jgi:hypothetical protein
MKRPDRVTTILIIYCVVTLIAFAGFLVYLSIDYTKKSDEQHEKFSEAVRQMQDDAGIIECVPADEWVRELKGVCDIDCHTPFKEGDQRMSCSIFSWSSLQNAR